MRRMWELKQAVEGVLELYLYGDVEGEVYDWKTEKYVESENSANAFKAELAKYPNVNQINLYINSYGGSVFEGTAIYNQLKRHPAKKVVYIDGFACSIASVIAMCGDEIVMPKNAMMMIHNMLMGVYGNSEEIRRAADDLDKINDAGKQAYLQKSNGKISEDELTEMMDKETWLTAEECIRFGLADRYADEQADMTNAVEILQKANEELKSMVAERESFAAQMRQLTEPCIGESESDPKEATEEETAEAAEEKREAEQPNGIMQMLNGFFNA